MVKSKIIVILGPTSSGKSDIAIRLARKFNGEIISADSRQVYRDLNIGSGKEPGYFDKNKKACISSGIPHYAIDIISPKTDYSVTKFKSYADKIIADILQRQKLPIICGGTGFWIKTLVDDLVYPEVKPNFKLRKELSKKTSTELFSELKKLDSVRAKNIDAKNPVRLIRAIEICKTLGKVPTLKEKGQERKNEFLQIGINLSKEKLQENIKKRLRKRFAAGMVAEVERLHSENKLSWKRIESFGLGYLWIAKYLQKQLPEKELFEKVYFAEKDYAKRQLTWFGKDKHIIWLSEYKKIETIVQKFL